MLEYNKTNTQNVYFLIQKVISYCCMAVLNFNRHKSHRNAGYETYYIININVHTHTRTYTHIYKHTYTHTHTRT